MEDENEGDVCDAIRYERARGDDAVRGESLSGAGCAPAPMECRECWVREEVFYTNEYDTTIHYTNQRVHGACFAVLSHGGTERVPENLQRERMTNGRQAGDAQQDRRETVMRNPLDTSFRLDEEQDKTALFPFFLVNQRANGRKQDTLGRALVNAPNQGTLCTVNEKRCPNEFTPHERSD